MRFPQKRGSGYMLGEYNKFSKKARNGDLLLITLNLLKELWAEVTDQEKKRRKEAKKWRIVVVGRFRRQLGK